MITNRVLNAVMLPADKVEDSGRGLAPMPGTDLATLFDSSVSAGTAASMNTMDTEVDIHQLIEDSQVQDNGAIPHDIAMEDAVKRVGRVVRGNLDIARNQVIPKTKELHEKYLRRMEDLDLEISQPAVIIPNVYHDIWETNELHGLVSRFENVPVNQYKFRFSLPKLNGEQIQQMMKTGISSLDDAVDDWLKDQPADKLLYTYERIFINGEAPVGKVPGANHLTDHGLDRNDLLIAHLISIGFEDNLPDGVNVNLTDLREAMSNVRQQSGRALIGTLNRRERDIRNKILAYGVQRTPWKYSTSERVEISVNNDVYLKFLNEGGKVEAIYGAALKGVTLNFNDLIDKLEHYVNFYERKIGLHRQEVGSRVYMAQQEAARFAMRDMINEIDEEELPRDRAELHSKTQKCIGCFEPRYFKDEIYVLRSLVCDVLYAGTNVKMVLDAMDAAQQSDPDISARECALHATIDLIARWVSSQIKVNYT